jgi:hypothetical protein
MTNLPFRRPPKKKAGQGIGPRRVNGAALDVRSGAAFVGISEKAIRGRVERRLIPFRRMSGRIIFLRSELESWLNSLEGCPLEEALANVKERQ